MEHSYFSAKVSILQIAKVVDFMESHPELVHVNLLSSQGDELWEELADSLNAEIVNGGSFQPTKNWKGWWANYAAQLKSRYFSGLRKQSQAKILTTSDARLLKVMGYHKVQEIWNAEQELLNSTSVDENGKVVKTKGDLGIRIKSCFTLKKDDKPKPKKTLFPLPDAITTAQRKSASSATLKTIEKSQATQTCDPFLDTIADIQRKSASGATPKTSKKSQATQTHLFTDAIATAQRKSISCATLKTSEKSIATQTCDPFPDALAPAQRKLVSCVTLKTSKQSKAKQACDPFPDVMASAQRKSVSCSILKTSKQSKTKQACDPFPDVMAPAQQKSVSCSILKTSKQSKAKQACDPFPDVMAPAQQKSVPCSILKTSKQSKAKQACDPFPDVMAPAEQKSVSCSILKTSKQSKAKQACDPFPDVMTPAQRKSVSCSILKTSKKSQAKRICDPNKQNADAIATALQKSAADINPSPLKPPTLPRRSVYSPTDNTIGEKIGAFTPNVTTAEAILSIAKEFNLDSTLAKQKMELKQERLRLHKRKVDAVQFISKKMCLF